MKNKDIEYLLNTMKDKECYYVGMNGCLYQDLTKEEISLLLSYIEQLENNRDKAIEYINENWGHWCSNHYKYATETIDILKGDSDYE